jgi:hypothetical protein
VAFALGFVLVPELWGASMVHWRDVTTTSFALAGVAAWLAAARRRSRALLALAVAAFSMSAALRYNAILLIALAIPLMVWRPFLEPKPPAGLRPQLALALAVGLALAWASTQWRLPDLKQPERADNFAGAQEFDLLGISACADKTYLPPAMTAGWPIAPKQIRMAYDPRHLQIAFRTAPGAPRIVETTAGGEVRKIWSIAVRREPRCYLAHRAAVFVQQMGLAKDGVFYVTDLEIAPNDYGLTPAHPRLLQAFAEYIKVRQKEIWRRPFWLYLLAPIAVAAVWRRNGARLLFLALLGGAFAYPALLFVASPAADARYIFPSSAVCALLIAAAGAIFMDRRARRAPPSAGT